jgi:hypothetical protein
LQANYWSFCGDLCRSSLSKPSVGTLETKWLLYVETMFPLSQSLLWRLTSPTCLGVCFSGPGKCLIKSPGGTKTCMLPIMVTILLWRAWTLLVDGDYNRYGRNVEIGGGGHHQIICCEFRYGQVQYCSVVIYMWVMQTRCPCLGQPSWKVSQTFWRWCPNQCHLRDNRRIYVWHSQMKVGINL